MTDMCERPLIIGLCGRSGAGKGCVSEIFRELGIPSVDTDAVYRELTAPCESRERLSPCMRELAQLFGEEIIAKDNSLDRRAVVVAVFAEDGKDKLRQLNAVTHKHILRRTDELIGHYARNGAFAVAVDAPLLFESGYDKKCDVTVAVTAPHEVLKARIMRRDGISEEMAQRRLASQKSDGELEDLADLVIVNDGSLEELREKVKDVISYALEKGKKKK